MRAAVYTKPGGSDVIAVVDVPEPRPGPDEVLVEVAFAGLNRADILERRGRYGKVEDAADPPICGLEYAGTVVAAGAHVRRPSPGDRVFGITSSGAHAQRVAVNAGTAMRIPAELDLAAAAAVPEAFLTAWDALFRVGRFGLGMTVLVHAAGSGVGLAGLALAKAAGGTTVGTSRSADKLARAGRYGLDYGALLDEDWVAVAQRVTDGRGVDVVLDFVGGATFDRNVAALAVHGRIVQIGTLGGSTASVAFGPLMAKRAALHGTMLRTRPLDEKIALARDFEAQIVPLFAAGVLRPLVDRVFPLAELARAHEYMEQDQNFGKIVIAVGAATERNSAG